MNATLVEAVFGPFSFVVVFAAAAAILGVSLDLVSRELPVLGVALGTGTIAFMGAAKMGTACTTAGAFARSWRYRMLVHGVGTWSESPSSAPAVKSSN